MGQKQEGTGWDGIEGECEERQLELGTLDGCEEN